MMPSIQSRKPLIVMETRFWYLNPEVLRLDDFKSSFFKKFFIFLGRQLPSGAGFYRHSCRGNRPMIPA